MCGLFYLCFSEFVYNYLPNKILLMVTFSTFYFHLRLLIEWLGGPLCEGSSIGRMNRIVSVGERFGKLSSWK